MITTAFLNAERLFVRKILERSNAYDWSLQGFGMLRLYLNQEMRLHVWSNKFKTPNVTILHNHPWDFESRIICGRIVNTKYSILPKEANYREETILCGPGGRSESSNRDVFLEATSVAQYAEGEWYMQRASEIHATDYADGTVTLCSRHFHEDTEHAQVYVPIGEQWVSAEPRAATQEEVYMISRQALMQLEAL